MNKDRARKLKRMLTTREPPRDPPEPAVVICPAGTLPDEYAQQLRAEGRKAPALYVNATPTAPEEIAAWEAASVRYQAWLRDHAHRIAGGAEPSRCDLIREAYRASLTDEPMPTD